MGTSAVANFRDQTIWTGDNLPIMRGMNSEIVDLIYLDPPFNSNANYAAPIGSKAAGAAFKDTWGMDEIKFEWHGELEDSHPGLYALIRAAGQVHGKSTMAYLIYMAPRIVEMHRLLKPTGTIYLHCDPYASHYLKAMMDSIFGKPNFQNEIVWAYKSGGASPKRFAKKHDNLLLYTKSKDYVFNPQKEKSYNRGLKRYGFKGVKEFEDSHGWHTLVNMKDVWQIDMVGRTSAERTGYPTQKPLALLDRVILASSNPGDMVLDPFCGCATACLAASKHGREWVGIDISPKAAQLVQSRMSDELNMFFKGVVRTDIPQRTDVGKIPKYSSDLNKNWLYGVQSGNCNLCGYHYRKKDMTVDHMVPQSKGGSDHIKNLQLLCGHCNTTKRDRTQEEAIKLLKAKDIDTDTAKKQRKELEKAKAKLPEDWPKGYA